MTSTWDLALDPPHEDEAFDYPGYLSVLELLRQPTLKLPAALPLDLPVWHWPPPRTYNGFTPAERIKGWQLSRWAEAQGVKRRCPKLCSVCRSIQKVGWHSENYYDLLTQIPLCQACHFTVHGRFRQPMAWRSFKDRHGGQTPKRWFEWLPRGPIDLAGYLRNELGTADCDPLRFILTG
jgi:hypothetical protein